MHDIRIIDDRPVSNGGPMRAVRHWLSLGLSVVLGVFIFCGCGPVQSDRVREGEESKKRIIATTSLIGDLVGRIVGDTAELSVLIPPGTDPHGYHFSPRDFVLITKADLVFLNGAELESQLNVLIRMARDRARLLSDAKGLEPLRMGGACGNGHHHHHHHHGAMDPHFWTDPHRVKAWVRYIEQEVRAADPDHGPLYERNAKALLKELEDLDRWIEERVSRIPVEDRILVTDHYVFGYFARRYGFREGGALVRGLSTLSQPSARDLAELATLLDAEGVPAIFVGVDVSGELAERIAEDLGIRVIRVYTGALSPPGGPAPDYIAYMRYNVNAFVEGLIP